MKAAARVLGFRRIFKLIFYSSINREQAEGSAEMQSISSEPMGREACHRGGMGTASEAVVGEDT